MPQLCGSQPRSTWALQSQAQGRTHGLARLSPGAEPGPSRLCLPGAPTCMERWGPGCTWPPSLLTWSLLGQNQGHLPGQGGISFGLSWGLGLQEPPPAVDTSTPRTAGSAKDATSPIAAEGVGTGQVPCCSQAIPSRKPRPE